MRVGDRVEWRVSSGFCSLAYFGRIKQINKRNNRALVAFADDYRPQWIALAYLTLVTEHSA